MIDFLYRRYICIRRGIGHIGVIFSFWTAVSTFYLSSRDWLYFKDLGYIELVGLGCLIFLPLVERVGNWDYKKGLFGTETSIATEQNPYAVYKFTEKERMYILPVSLAAADVSLKVNRQLAQLFSLNQDTFKALGDLEKAKAVLEMQLRSNAK